jgi:NitT/TauT family transport system permease protein
VTATLPTRMPPPVTAPGRRGRGSLARLQDAAYPLAAIAILVGLWQAAPALGLVRRTVFPTATDVLSDLPATVTDDGFLSSLSLSATRWGLGLAFGVVIGIAIGLAMARSRFVFVTLNPLLTFTYAAPKAALVLPLVLLFGISHTSMAGVVFLGALVPVVTAAYHGGVQVNQQYLWSARSMGVPDRALPFRVVLPAALPQILTGCRIAVGFSLLNLLGAEFVVRQGGIGSFLYNNIDTGQFVRVWSIALFLAFLGYLADVVYGLVVRRLFPWTGDGA